MFDRRRCLSAIKKSLLNSWRNAITLLFMIKGKTELPLIQLLFSVKQNRCTGSKEVGTSLKLDGRKEMLRKRRQNDLQN